jgi:hypothetical protein
LFHPTLTPEQQTEAQCIADLLMETARAEILAIAGLMASRTEGCMAWVGQGLQPPPRTPRGRPEAIPVAGLMGLDGLGDRRRRQVGMDRPEKSVALTD